MSKCSHGIYIGEHDTVARYCQQCTPNSGGGLLPHDPPTYDLDSKPICPRCRSLNSAYDFETNAFVCFECDFTV